MLQNVLKNINNSTSKITAEISKKLEEVKTYNQSSNSEIEITPDDLYELLPMELQKNSILYKLSTSTTPCSNNSLFNLFIDDLSNDGFIWNLVRNVRSLDDFLDYLCRIYGPDIRPYLLLRLWSEEHSGWIDILNQHQTQNHRIVQVYLSEKPIDYSEQTLDYFKKTTGKVTHVYSSDVFSQMKDFEAENTLKLNRDELVQNRLANTQSRIDEARNNHIEQTEKARLKNNEKIAAAETFGEVMNEWAYKPNSRDIKDIRSLLSTVHLVFPTIPEISLSDLIGGGDIAVKKKWRQVILKTHPDRHQFKDPVEEYKADFVFHIMNDAFKRSL